MEKIMKPSTIRKAVQEAQRFIDQAKAVLATVEKGTVQNLTTGHERKVTSIPWSTRANGTLRRRSHDVSEAMIALRQDQKWSD
jgi:hypothetical protein